MIGIINYGLGNLRSIQKVFESFGQETIITANVDEINQLDAVVLPGVGAFGAAMQELEELNLTEVLKTKINTIPTLGICLGMQLLFESSEEDPEVEGLKIIHGTVKKLLPLNNVRIPHTGWNELISTKDPYFKGYAYFNHSYYCEPDQKDTIISFVIHGDKMPVIIQQDNILGVQFHPEKSQATGREVIKYFISQIQVEELL